jgi:hypothetical protein
MKKLLLILVAVGVALALAVFWAKQARDSIDMVPDNDLDGE